MRVESESRSVTGNNGGEWNHFPITQTIPEQHDRRARNQGNTNKNSLLGTAHIQREVLM